MNGFYEVVEIDNFSSVLAIRERSFRSLQPKEILIKIFCTPINPADILFIKGQYGNKKPELFPMIPGLEGSGEIVAVGVDVDSCLIGKRAAVFCEPEGRDTFDGMWAEYHYITIEDKIMIFDNEIAYEKICFLINPLTAVAMLDICKKKKYKSILLSAAASSLGKMFNRLCMTENIEIINLVLNEEQEKELKLIGIRNVFRLNDRDCFIELNKICYQFKTLIGFDCIGGDYTSHLLNCLAPNSVLYHFGNLEDKDIKNIISSELVYKHKSIKGFWLNKWIKSLSKDEYDYWWGYIRSELQTGSFLFHTHIAGSYDLEEVDFAITDYQMGMSKGKIVIAPYRVLVKESESA
jgi:NADPH2:quinone reductase